MEWDFKNDRDRRDLITCGAAAGIAASFQMASWWRSALLWRAFFTTALIAIVLQALAASEPPPWLLPLNVINKIKLLPMNVINKIKVCQLTPKDLIRLLASAAAFESMMMLGSIFQKNNKKKI
ncbi:chloride channel-like protein CLC-g [Pyrus ussuriensis x Pyrus communis]|uniref:Chloride channel-like protein CLC-g n=1 Tax=Pyrus ussuriensis x Pyrus communis TaxID=2448454 RepID=A0A5N5HJ97_9ROSA|nr:chloride channel-like protein CLC-g [Pyrus ussuriensis x Pyrus communis]